MDNKVIWIDLDNSPHVPLFAPIIRHYREHNVDIILTARDHAQTIELLDLNGLRDACTVVGRHYGKSKFGKIRGLVVRAKQLVSHINTLKKDVAVAVSHGSRSMVLAARWLKIPVVTMFDYEYTETNIFNRFSAKVLVPDGIPDETLDAIDLPAAKRRKYAGIKEELYVRDFSPSGDLRATLSQKYGFSRDSVIAVVRPPATTANYHTQQSEILLDDILRFLLNAEGVVTVVVPRTDGQAEDLKKQIGGIPDPKGMGIVLDCAVDGLNLAATSDLLISGGGTMNREAALLGVPVYSIFAGRQGALDRGMESSGIMTFIRDARDLSKIRLERRKVSKPRALTDRVEKFVINEIDEYL